MQTRTDDRDERAPESGLPDTLAGRARLDAQREMLSLIETTGDLSNRRYEPRDLPSAITLARLIASSPLCPPPLRGREADVLLVMMTGAEMGLSTMQALRNLHVIDGRIGMSAAMIRSRCQSHPDCEVFEVAEADATHAVVEVKKRSWGERRLVVWTLDDAERAQLTQPDSLWSRWPQEMCVARATTRAATMYFPEVTSGIFAEEDLKAMPPPEPVVVEAPGAPDAPMSALDAFAAAGEDDGEEPAAGEPAREAGDGANGRSNGPGGNGSRRRRG
jgi:RecT family protein